MLRRRSLLALSATAVVVALLVAYRILAPEPGLPRHEGRSVSRWFDRYHRLVALRDDGNIDYKGLTECQDAFLEMGPGAIPFLAQRALGQGTDSGFRTLVRSILTTVPGQPGRDAFAPEAVAPEAALDLLRSLRPPLAILSPFIEEGLRLTNENVRGRALSLLGTVGDGASDAARRLASELHGELPASQRGLAMAALKQLGARSAPVLEEILRLPVAAEFPGHIVDWAARVGPDAKAAVPLLEGLLKGADRMLRISASVSLLEIVPDHDAATTLLVQSMDVTTFDAKLTTNGVSSAREAVIREILRLGTKPNTRLGSALESVLENDTGDWNTWGTMTRLADTYLRVAPERAEAWLRPRSKDLDKPGGLESAGLLLKKHPGDPEATALLARAIRANDDLRRQSLFWLGSAASTNRAALEALDHAERVPPESSTEGAAGRDLAAFNRKAVPIIRGFIRQRAARAARGLPETWD